MMNTELAILTLLINFTSRYVQEAELSKRDHAVLHVNLAKLVPSITIIEGLHNYCCFHRQH